jgi:hypothetical protein
VQRRAGVAHHPQKLALRKQLETVDFKFHGGRGGPMLWFVKYFRHKLAI